MATTYITKHGIVVSNVFTLVPEEGYGLRLWHSLEIFSFIFFQGSLASMTCTVENGHKPDIKIFILLPFAYSTGDGKPSPLLLDFTDKVVLT